MPSAKASQTETPRKQLGDSLKLPISVACCFPDSTSDCCAHTSRFCITMKLSNGSHELRVSIHLSLRMTNLPGWRAAARAGGEVMEKALRKARRAYPGAVAFMHAFALMCAHCEMCVRERGSASVCKKHPRACAHVSTRIRTCCLQSPTNAPHAQVPVGAGQI